MAQVGRGGCHGPGWVCPQPPADTGSGCGAGAPASGGSGQLAAVGRASAPSKPLPPNPGCVPLRAGSGHRLVPGQHEAGGGAALRADHADAGQGAGTPGCCRCRRRLLLLVAPVPAWCLGRLQGIWPERSAGGAVPLRQPPSASPLLPCFPLMPLAPPHPGPPQGIEVLTKAVEACKAAIEGAKGRMVVKEEARAVSEKEERALEEELQAAEAANREVSGDTDEVRRRGCLVVHPHRGLAMQPGRGLLPHAPMTGRVAGHATRPAGVCASAHARSARAGTTAGGPPLNRRPLRPPPAGRGV